MGMDLMAYRSMTSEVYNELKFVDNSMVFTVSAKNFKSRHVFNDLTAEKALIALYKKEYAYVRVQTLVDVIKAEVEAKNSYVLGIDSFIKYISPYTVKAFSRKEATQLRETLLDAKRNGATVIVISY